jgi:(1->4)-alpha-D-glucan 1-alpha-D-glucosylmutase
MPRLPMATYRVQLNREFQLDAVRALLPFLEKLGISDIYASPVLGARPGSMHGYDVTDPSAVNPEIGGDEAFRALCHDLKQRGMGLLLDIVPNHMAADSRNRWWMDVLENGSSSEYAGFFDVEWSPGAGGGEEKIFLPVLGSPYGEVLDRGELHLAIDDAGFCVRYFDKRFPLDTSSYRLILDAEAGNAPATDEFRALVNAIARLPERTTTSWVGIEGRRRDVPQILEQLRRLYRESAGFKAYVDGRLDALNGVPGDPASFDPLHDVIDAQPYRLAWWRGAREWLNYRRFFDVSELIALRAENPEVFARTHERILQWVTEGCVTGLRVDHIDGLLEPHEYLDRLRSQAGSEAYLVVEKILIDEETLPRGWPIQGTTGYDFLGMLNGVLIDSANLDMLQDTYARFTGLNWRFEDAAYDQKRWIIDHLFRGEISALGLHLARISEADRYARDLSPTELRAGLAAVTACLGVYRVYIDSQTVSETDRRYVRSAIACARDRERQVPAPIYDFLERLFTLRFPPRAEEDQRGEWVRFVMRWQQLTGPATAKGVEDTTLYVYNRLVSMNEVGAQSTAVTLDRFHEFNARRQRNWPATMNATSTHDTKRSEDVRARISVISEMPVEWGRYLQRWARWNRDKKRMVDGRPAPDPNEEILLYQTMVGAWPLHDADVPSFVERLKQYMLKATREAKVYSNWREPNEAHERAIFDFIDAILEPADSNRFPGALEELRKRISFYGGLNSLSQTLVKITSPGIPDFYQGTEFWNFSLVDPDNRRPVDVEARLRAMSEMDGWSPRELMDNWRDGRVKAFVTRRALAARKPDPDLFVAGDYIPLACAGARKKHVITFARRFGQRWAITVAPRLMSELSPSEQLPIGRRTWKDTRLVLPEGAPARWTEAITGQKIESAELAAILTHFPVALLVGSL